MGGKRSCEGELNGFVKGDGGWKLREGWFRDEGGHRVDTGVGEDVSVVDVLVGDVLGVVMDVVVWDGEIDDDCALVGRNVRIVVAGGELVGRGILNDGAKALRMVDEMDGRDVVDEKVVVEEGRGLLKVVEGPKWESVEV